MDRRTVALYEDNAEQWIAARPPRHLDDGLLSAFARRLRRGARIADLGCGPGWYAEALRDAGHRVVALDAAMSMLTAVGARTPLMPRVCADLAALPFRDGALDAAWAANCYAHVPSAELPLALARLHWALRPGGLATLSLPNLEWKKFDADERPTDEQERRFAGGEIADRLFTAVTAARARSLLVGAGFEAVRISLDDNRFWHWAVARRARTLPDLVGPNLRLLVCGLNPSLYSADLGIPFARAGNRFWKAARAAGLVERERDPLDAFRRGIGMTDLVKRATAGADEIEPREYERGLKRVESLVRRYQPAAICFVGLDGWRKIVDRRARPGWVGNGFGERPAYLMPSTSGRNARVPVGELAEHLRAAAGQGLGFRGQGLGAPPLRAVAARWPSTSTRRSPTATDP